MANPFQRRTYWRRLFAARSALLCQRVERAIEVSTQIVGILETKAQANQISVKAHSGLVAVI